MPKVVGLQELCEQPIGAIFSEFDPDIVRCLFRKGTSLPKEPMDAETQKWYGGRWCDFFYHTLLAEVNHNKRVKEGEQPIWNDPNMGGRWGNLDPKEQFVLYDDKDIATMISLLQDKESP